MSKFKPLIWLNCLLFLSTLQAQLVPMVDRNYHPYGIEKSCISTDKTLAAQYSLTGGITLHHTETGKLVQNWIPGTKLVWMGFSAKANEMLYVEKINNNEVTQSAYGVSNSSKYSHLHIGRLDCTNGTRELIYSYAKDNLKDKESWEVTLDAENALLALFNNSGHVVGIDLNKRKIYLDQFDDNIRSIQFNEDAKIRLFYPTGSDGDAERGGSLTARQKTIKEVFSGKIVTLPFGSTIMFNDSTFGFFDSKKRLQRLRPNQRDVVIDTHRISLEKLLLDAYHYEIDSNQDIYLWTSYYVDSFVTNDVYPYFSVCLKIDGADGSLLWVYDHELTFELGQHLPGFMKYGCLLNEEVLLCLDENGIFTYLDKNTGRKLYHSSPNGTSLVSFAFSPDLTSIYSSVQNDHTYKTEINKITQVALIDSGFNRYVFSNFQNEISLSRTASAYAGKKHTFINSQGDTMRNRMTLHDIKHSSQSAYNSTYAHSFKDRRLSYEVNNTDNTVALTQCEVNQIDSSGVLQTSRNTYFVEDVGFLPIKNDSILPEFKESQIIVSKFNEMGGVEQTKIIPSFYTFETHLSMDGRYITYAPALNEWNDPYSNISPVFNISNKTWRTRPFNAEAHPRKTYFSDRDAVAISIWADSTIERWSTRTGETTIELKYEKDAPYDIVFNSIRDQILIPVKDTFFLYDFQLNEKGYLINTYCPRFSELQMDPSGEILIISNQNSGKAMLVDIQQAIKDKTINQKHIIYQWEIRSQTWDEQIKNHFSAAYFEEKGGLAYLFDGINRLELWNLRTREKLATVIFYPNREWLVFDTQGYFDASASAREYLYYLKGMEPLLYDQIKDRFWEPGLLNSILQSKRPIHGSIDTKTELYPEFVSVECDTNGKMTISLREREGGIGPVSFYLNGKEISADINRLRKKKMELNLSDFESYLYRNGQNLTEFVAYNDEGWLGSRRKRIYLDAHLDRPKGDSRRPKFGRTTQIPNDKVDTTSYSIYGVFVGNSEYNNPSLNLSFADADARKLQDAMSKVSSALFDTTSSQLITITSDQQDEHKTSKINILNQLRKIKEIAKPEDVVVVFLSGHGITLGDDFYYLLPGSGNIDIEQNVANREKVTLSSAEIKEELKSMRSSKQILIIDACHSGKITDIFQQGSKALSTSQDKALEQLKDKTGVYVIASSEAEQKSFETGLLNQGVLTFSLIDGLSGSAISETDEIIGILDLLTYASQRVEEISKAYMGVSQRPVLGIAQGAHSYPIGIKNTDLEVQLPSDKLRMGRPSFVHLPLWNDPNKITLRVLKELEARGVLSGPSPYRYTSNPNQDDLINLSGKYEIIGNVIYCDWNIVKNQKSWISNLQTNGKINDLQQFINQIINISEQAIRDTISEEL